MFTFGCLPKSPLALMPLKTCIPAAFAAGSAAPLLDSLFALQDARPKQIAIALAAQIARVISDLVKFNLVFVIRLRL